MDETKLQALPWSSEQRLLWIDDVLNVYGFISRGHIMRKFRIGPTQSSKTLHDFIEIFGNIEFDQSTKVYIRPGAKVVLDTQVMADFSPAEPEDDQEKGEA